MTPGYQALHETAAQIELSPRGRIKVTGDDRIRLLHAMTTNHVKDLVPGAGCYAFFLNAVGRVLADANILCFDDYLLLDTEPEVRKFLLEHLDKFIIADDVTLHDETDSTFALGIEGPQAGSALVAAGYPVPELPLAHRQMGPFTIIRASATGAPGFRIVGPRDATLPLPALAQASNEDANTVRLENFFPRYGEDITTSNLAQETHIADALHFTKGCYLGQEIVERVRSRGHVNRMLTGLRIEGNEPIVRGSKVSLEGSEVGEITSSASSPSLGVTVALAMVRINAAKPGVQVLVGERKAYAEAIKSART